MKQVIVRYCDILSATYLILDANVPTFIDDITQLGFIQSVMSEEKYFSKSDNNLCVYITEPDISYPHNISYDIYVMSLRH